MTEGIIDFVRGIEGTSVAAVVRDKRQLGRGAEVEPSLHRWLR